MLLFKTKKVKKDIEAKLLECNMYLDNNYRDLAKSAYAEAKEMIEKSLASGELKEKEAADLAPQLSKCSTRIEHMGHY